MTVKKYICFENSAKWFASTKNNLTTNHAEALDTRQKRSVDGYKIFSSALLYSVLWQTFRYSQTDFLSCKKTWLSICFNRFEFCAFWRVQTSYFMRHQNAKCKNFCYNLNVNRVNVLFHSEEVAYGLKKKTRSLNFKPWAF